MGKPSRATVSQNVPAGEDTNTSSSPKKAKPTTRARTVLSKVTRHRAKNLKFKVKWNRNGEAIGPYRANFKSYLGMSTRHRVNITYETWKDVPDHIKDAIYIDVSGAFEVPESKRKELLSNAASLFRDFKNKLALRFMYLDEEKTKINPHPPSIYTFITQNMWDTFVDYRQSEEFKGKSEKNRKAALENDYKYRASRKGYAGVEEEMILEAAEELSDFEDAPPVITPPRDKVWLRARQDKDGNMDESVQQVATQMDVISQKASKGEIKLSGRQDLLATVLAKKEHPGRVVGVGGRVTITQYFGRKNDKVAQDSELIQKMKAEIEMLKRALENESKKHQSHQGQGEVQSEKETCSSIDFPEGWTNCQLASPDPGHAIVAIGTVYNGPDMQDIVIHNMPLKPGHMRVSVIEPKMAEAPLPVPTEEASIVFDAVNSYIQWPKNLIFLEKELHESNGEKGKDKCVNLDALSESSNTTYKDCPKKDQSHEIELTKEQHSKLSTPTLQMMYKLARTIGTVSIPAHKNLMMEADFLWVTKEEIFQWIFQEQIQATHVSIYLGNLLDTYPDKNRLSQFKFLCPHKIAEIPLVIPSKQQAVLIAEKREDQARYIAQAMENANKNQMFFAPYNSKKHWMLCVIHPFKQMIFWLDPLGAPVRHSIKTVIELSIKIWNAQRNSNRPNKTTKWVEIKCPKQTNNVDCGFYILKFVQEIISKGCDYIPEQYYPEFGGSRPYTKDKIDELRDEWAKYVQNFIA